MRKSVATYMLVYQHNCYVLSVFGKGSKGILDVGHLSLGVDDEKVALRVWRVCDMLSWSASDAR